MTSSGTQNWLKANTGVTSFLNRVCAEPETLFVHEGAVLRLTCNLIQNNLHQGQYMNILFLLYLKYIN